MLPEAVKLQLMQSLVLSVFCYCYPAYGNGISKEDSQRIQRNQNVNFCFPYSLRRFDHVSPYREDANPLPMETVWRVLARHMMHKGLKYGKPLYLCERLKLRADVS